MKIKKAFLVAANLRPYSGSIRAGASVGIGRGRHWRINCDGDFQFSEPYEHFDRWANSVSSTVRFELFDTPQKFVQLVNYAEALAIANDQRNPLITKLRAHKELNAYSE